MSMTASMCLSMTGRPTRAQIINEQIRNSYSYLPKGGQYEEQKIQTGYRQMEKGRT